MNRSRLYSVLAASVLLVAALATIALASTHKSRSARKPTERVYAPPPAAKPSAALQRKLSHARRTGRRGTRVRASPADQAALARDFAVFRRPSQPGDTPPGAHIGDIARKVRNATAVSSPGDRPTASNRDVFLVEHGSDLCVVAGGGTGCGPIGFATTHPVTLGTGSADRTSEVLWGAASDNVVAVKITSTTGQQVSTQPTNNLYVVELAGVVKTVRFTRSDGRSTVIVGYG